MKRKLISVILIMAFIIPNIFENIYADAVNIKSPSAILYEPDSGRILFSKDADKKMFPASTTKIMTALLAIENSKPDDIVVIDDEAPKLGVGSHIALDSGEEVKMSDLLYAMMVASANDAAIAVAKHISSSLDKFVELMNQKAKELGCTGTHFVNPNGLHDENHYSTAHDLALIMAACIKNDDFIKYASSSYHQIPATNKQSEERFLNTSNKMLYSQQQIDVNGATVPIKYDGYICGKTGYTTNSNNCLVSYAKRDNEKLICVVLGADGRDVYVDTHKILDYGFNNFKTVNLVNSREYIADVSVEGSPQERVAGIVVNSFSFPLTKENDSKIERTFTPLKLKAPVKEGDKVGDLTFTMNGSKIISIDVVSAQTAAASKGKSFFAKAFSVLPWFLLALLLSVRIVVVKCRKKRKSARRKLNTDN